MCVSIFFSDYSLLERCRALRLMMSMITIPYESLSNTKITLPSGQDDTVQYNTFHHNIWHSDPRLGAPFWFQTRQIMDSRRNDMHLLSRASIKLFVVILKESGSSSWHSESSDTKGTAVIIDYQSRDVTSAATHVESQFTQERLVSWVTVSRIESRRDSFFDEEVSSADTRRKSSSNESPWRTQCLGHTILLRVWNIHEICQRHVDSCAEFASNTDAN